MAMKFTFLFIKVPGGVSTSLGNIPKNTASLMIELIFGHRTQMQGYDKQIVAHSTQEGGSLSTAQGFAFYAMHGVKR